eukprot:TRINITY_DN96333_c0_g1_i1.p1 TRINITY_DN96333_c0_g1~~TRINITY_DN96333_c0_g1_i1.p1  ORF type:complete len:521 (-),score=74.09 TRINITY_DN96333_c0_g1_i1:30-1592(-)
MFLCHGNIRCLLCLFCIIGAVSAIDAPVCFKDTERCLKEEEFEEQTESFLKAFYTEHVGVKCAAPMKSYPFGGPNRNFSWKMMWDAVQWCSHHPGCHGVMLYSGSHPSRIYEWIGRPKFCVRNITNTSNELLRSRSWVTFSKNLPRERESEKYSLQSVPARCSHAGRVVPCFDPLTADCIDYEFMPWSRAFVFTHDLRAEYAPNWSSLRWLKEWASRNHIDVVLIVPKRDIAQHPLGKEVVKQLGNLGIRIHEVDWVDWDLEKMRKVPSGKMHHWDTVLNSWCISRDLFKLHVFGLDHYEAVVFYDNDVFVAADNDSAAFDSLFRCARQGYFMATSYSGAFEPLAAGMFALQPSKQVLRALRHYLRDYATYWLNQGWDGTGFGPWGCLDASDKWCLRSWHVGGECGQGLLYSLFFKENPIFNAALATVEPPAVKPIGVMIDGCIWAFENQRFVDGMPENLNPCDDIYETGRCHEVQAVHSLVEDRGCSSQLSSLPGVKLVPISADSFSTPDISEEMQLDE